MKKRSILPRLIAILQLISSFSLFLWILFDPFMGEHFRLKEEMLLIQNIRGGETLISKLTPLEAEKLRRNQARYSSLTPSARVSIDDKAHLIEWKMSVSSLSKIGMGLKKVFFETPLILLAWIFLAALFSIGCLKGNPTLIRFSWIAPLALIGYAYGIWLTATPPTSPYPLESELVSNYLKRPLGLSLEEQVADLKKGWELYLIKSWANETPSKDPLLFAEQKEKGEFAFNVNLLKLKENETKKEGSLLWIFLGFVQGMSLFLLTLRQQKSEKLRLYSP